MKTKLLALSFVLAAIVISCKKEEPATKTNQQCMDENGYCYYATSSGACRYSAGLALTSTTSHWTWGGWYGYSVQLIRDGSATGGTGRMKHNWTGAPTSNFTWQINQLDESMIMITYTDTTYMPSEQVTQITQIEPNTPFNPSAAEMNYTTGSGTGWDQMNLVSGGL